MKKLDEIKYISTEEATPLVKALVAMIESLQEKIQCLENNAQQMRDEIAIL
jgi:methyl-accepting chemotaxis protein